VHFRAARDHAGRAIAPSMWQPYAAGLEVVEVPALHHAMVGDAAMAVIVPALRVRM